MPVVYFPLSHLPKRTQVAGLGSEPRRCDQEAPTWPHPGERLSSALWQDGLFTQGLFMSTLSCGLLPSQLQMVAWGLAGCYIPQEAHSPPSGGTRTRPRPADRLGAGGLHGHFLSPHIPLPHTAPLPISTQACQTQPRQAPPPPPTSGT